MARGLFCRKSCPRSWAQGRAEPSVLRPPAPFPWEPGARAGQAPSPREVRDLQPRPALLGSAALAGRGRSCERSREGLTGSSDGRSCSGRWTLSAVLLAACFLSLGEVSWDILGGLIPQDHFEFRFCLVLRMSIVSPKCLSQSSSLPSPKTTCTSFVFLCEWSQSLVGRCFLLCFDFCYFPEWFQ